jgi:beta-mannanase
VIPSNDLDATIAGHESWNSVTNYYPGDNYIDWIGTSIYGSTEPGKEWRSFNDIMDTAYTELESISTTKPFAILELGIIEDSEMGNKSEWMENALQAIENGTYPKVKAISYWNEKWEDKHKTIDLRINSSSQAKEIYKWLVSSPFFISSVQYEFSARL